MVGTPGSSFLITCGDLSRWSYSMRIAMTIYVVLVLWAFCLPLFLVLALFLMLLLFLPLTVSIWVGIDNALFLKEKAALLPLMLKVILALLV